MLATGIAPDYYEINGEVVTAFINGTAYDFDLSSATEGATLDSIEPIDGVTPIRHAVRESGELKVVLAQKVGAGHWIESDYFDAATYDPSGVHVIFDETKSFAGTPMVYTKNGWLTLSQDQLTG